MFNVNCQKVLQSGKCCCWNIIFHGPLKNFLFLIDKFYRPERERDRETDKEREINREREIGRERERGIKFSRTINVSGGTIVSLDRWDLYSLCNWTYSMKFPCPFFFHFHCYLSFLLPSWKLVTFYLLPCTSS